MYAPRVFMQIRVATLRNLEILYKKFFIAALFDFIVFVINNNSCALIQKQG